VSQGSGQGSGQGSYRIAAIVAAVPAQVMGAICSPVGTRLRSHASQCRTMVRAEVAAWSAGQPPWSVARVTELWASLPCWVPDMGGAPSRSTRERSNDDQDAQRATILVSRFGNGGVRRAQASRIEGRSVAMTL